MGKTSPTERSSKNGRPKRRKSSNNKYLKPGALAQIRYSKASASSKSCTDLGRKRVAVLTSKQNKTEVVEVCQSVDVTNSAVMLSPVKIESASEAGVADSLVMVNQHKLLKTPKTPCPVQREFTPGNGVVGLPDQNKSLATPKTPRAEEFEFALGSLVGLSNQSRLQSTPRTPRADDCESESRLESLPNDLLVKILCHLHHDQLRAVFHVSRRVRKAVIVARHFHFNYTTPDRTRQEMLNTMTPRPTDHWPFIGKGNGKELVMRSPHTPKAPRHGPRPPSRLKFTEMRQIAAVLFQESSLTPSLVPSVLPKPVCKSLASNRVLFYEDELCQAVAQNKLR